MIAEIEAEICNFVTNLLNEAQVWNLVEGIAARLMARGRLSAKAMERLRDEHPTSHDLILAPRRLVLKWAGEERSAQAQEIIAHWAPFEKRGWKPG